MTTPDHPDQDPQDGQAPQDTPAAGTPDGAVPFGPGTGAEAALGTPAGTAPETAEEPALETAEEPAPETPDDPAPGPSPTTVGHVRRAPRYGRFMWVGFLLGILASILLVAFTEGGTFGEDYSEQIGGSRHLVTELSDSNAIGLLVLTLGPAGILLGAVVAYVLDRRSLRRRDRATAGLVGPAR